MNLINELGVSYILVIADDQAGADAIVAGLQGLPLPPGKSLFVKAFAVEPLDNNKTAEAFEEAVARMAADPSIKIECKAISREFVRTENDGLKND